MNDNKDIQKRKFAPPLSHSNLTEHENLRSHYDPNGSWTGVPDGWDKDENGKKEVEAAKDMREYPLEGIIAPTNGDTYEQNTRNLTDSKDVESGSDPFDDRPFDDDHEQIERHPHKRVSPYSKNDVEAGIYPLGDIGEPAKKDGYPNAAEGRLPIHKEGIKEDVVPVQDVDDL